MMLEVRSAQEVEAKEAKIPNPAPQTATGTSYLQRGKGGYVRPEAVGCLVVNKVDA